MTENLGIYSLQLIIIAAIDSWQSSTPSAKFILNRIARKLSKSYTHPLRFSNLVIAPIVNGGTVLHLVVDIGNFRVKGAFFKEGKIHETFSLASQAISKMSLRSIFTGKKWDTAIIASVNDEVENEINQLLGNQKNPYFFVNHQDLTIKLDVDEPNKLGADRIANCYGAWVHFPKSDTIIVDIGSAITCDYTTHQKKYLGGTISPGMELSARALHDYSPRLPLVSFEKPTSPIGRTTATHLQSGIYYGMLGAIERLIKELKNSGPNPKECKVIAAGSGVAIDDTQTCQGKVAFVEDLKQMVDFVDPYLTQLGLHEILIKEYLKSKEK